MAGTNDHLHEERGYCGNRYCQVPDCLQHAEQGELYCASHLPPTSAFGTADNPYAFTHNARLGIGGGPTRATTLPTDPAKRKEYPLATGLFDYFPDALCAIAHLSWLGNQQHNPGQPLHWARGKSGDEDDTMLRHFVQRGTDDTDGAPHSVKRAWRSLAALQKEIERRKQDGTWPW